jgi:acetyl-CoA carboxylase biotin carboxylase subunit
MFDVLHGGLLTTVQDGGRHGYYSMGMPPSGAMDDFSYRAANLLVGNDEGAAALEATYLGPRLRFHDRRLVAVTGADLPPTVDGEDRPTWEAFEVEEGQTLAFGGLRAGARAYVAISGGLDVPVVLGSRSTYARVAFGGYEGRPLAKGDVLRLGKPLRTVNAPGARIDEELRPAFSNEAEVRIVVDLYSHRLTPESLEQFLTTEWTVTPDADRVGYRYRGVELEFLPRAEVPFGVGQSPWNTCSLNYPFGVIQLPGGVEPIVLMSDGVTGGNYASVGTVISADRDKVAQSKTHDRTRFVSVSVDDALVARAERQRRLAAVRSELTSAARSRAVGPRSLTPGVYRQPSREADEKTITSPLPGVFYRAPSPDEPPYVNEGDRVRPGDVVGLVEVMKTFNQVIAEDEGTIARFMVETGDLVQAGDEIVALVPGPAPARPVKPAPVREPVPLVDVVAPVLEAASAQPEAPPPPAPGRAPVTRHEPVAGRELRKVLIANRGEIAIRVIRACRELELTTVAVYSEADESAMHVSHADEAVGIGKAPAAHSYLNVDALLHAAKLTGADAIHPGYGFLSESPRFAAACTEAGLTFVGPPAAVLAQMGDKAAARALARRAGVPTVPGTDGVVGSAEALSVAAEVGYPVMIKAAAGGGGRGIRIARDARELSEAVKVAAREAEAAFGDGRLYLEKVIEEARHVEVQVLGDHHGNVVHLYERECSLQRRRQKIIEEAPSPALPSETRAAITEAAVRLAEAAGYVNAGTVEFLVDPAGDFYFMELNARLQVEHGVTEMVTGVDLVLEQLLIAAGEKLQYSNGEIPLRGSSFEFRINAEDPERDFHPSPGKITALELPGGPGVRMDTAAYQGYTVVPFYDSLIGKLLVWAPSREHAIRRGRRALRELRIEGIKTTIPLHLRLLEDERVRSGAFHTGYLESIDL